MNGTVGWLAYATVKLAGVPTEAMLDTGSSVSLMSQSLFFKVGKAAKIPVEAIQHPDVPLKDFSQNHIPVTGRVEIKVEARGKSIVIPIYILPGAEPPCLLGLSAVQELGLMTLSPEVVLKGDAEQKKPTAVAQLIQAQARYKSQYDKKSREPPYRVGDRIFIHMPQTQQGKMRKMARPYHGPY